MILSHPHPPATSPETTPVPPNILHPIANAPNTSLGQWTPRYTLEVAIAATRSISPACIAFLSPVYRPRTPDKSIASAPKQTTANRTCPLGNPYDVSSSLTSSRPGSGRGLATICLTTQFPPEVTETSTTISAESDLCFRATRAKPAHIVIIDAGSHQPTPDTPLITSSKSGTEIDCTHSATGISPGNHSNRAALTDNPTDAAIRKPTSALRQDRITSGGDMGRMIHFHDRAGREIRLPTVVNSTLCNASHA